MRILLATDYSDAVKYAEEYAVRLAKETNSILHLLHVYHFPLNATAVRPIEYAQIDYTRYVYEFEQSELRNLEMHRDELFRALNISPGELQNECIVRKGAVGKQIRQEAEESFVDLIITGTHGASRFRKTFFGSHSWDVIKKATIPVLAIPRDTSFTKIQNIVYATAYSEGELRIIDFIARLARELDAEVTVVHITNYALSRKFEEEMFEEFRRKIKRNISYEKLSVISEYYENIVKGLDDFCFWTKADWLIMSRKPPSLLERIFLPSLTRKMSFQTHIPLLVIPESFKLGTFNYKQLAALNNGRVKKNIRAY